MDIKDLKYAEIRKSVLELKVFIATNQNLFNPQSTLHRVLLTNLI